MELLNRYLETLPALRREVFHSEGNYNIWDEFINSDAHQISVVAGRRSGKTHALIRRAILRNERDVILAVGPMATMTSHRAVIETIAQDMGFSCTGRGMGYTRYEYEVNQHRILLMPIHSLRRDNISFLRNYDIIIDEPECSFDGTTSSELDYLEDLLQVTSVTLVGTYKKRGWSAVKGFHNRATFRRDAYVKVITTEDILGKEMVDDISRHIGPDMARREYYCIVS